MSEQWTEKTRKIVKSYAVSWNDEEGRAMTAALAEIDRLTAEVERREAQDHAMKEQYGGYLDRAEAAEAKLAGSEERTQIVFKAKNEWADRARAAEAELTRLRDALQQARDLGREEGLELALDVVQMEMRRKLSWAYSQARLAACRRILVGLKGIPGKPCRVDPALDARASQGEYRSVSIEARREGKP